MRGTDHLRRLAQETRGSEVAEAAAVLPLMFMMLLGIFWFGQAFAIYGAITRAAQDGARAGSVPWCATCSPGITTNAMNAANAVQTDLLASKLDPTLVTYPAPVPPLLACVGGAAVPCDGSASTGICIQARVSLTRNSGGVSSPGASNLCGIAVSFQYPYRFWLPFTSINNQTIWISATARVRMENPPQ